MEQRETAKRTLRELAEGERIYRCFVLFLAIVAMRELYGVADMDLMVRTSLNGGLKEQ